MLDNRFFILIMTLEKSKGRYFVLNTNAYTGKNKMILDKEINVLINEDEEIIDDEELDEDEDLLEDEDDEEDDDDFTNFEDEE